MNDEDFNDDNKDSGDLGGGHTVTALYEIIPIWNKLPGDCRTANITKVIN